MTAAFCDETEIQLKTMYSYKSYNADVTSVIPFNDEQLNILRDYTGRQNPSRVFRIIYREDKIYNMEFENYVGATEEQREYDVLYNTAFATIGEGAQAMEINCVTGEKDFNLRKDERLSDKSSCRLPERTDEIAITDLCASAFMRFGYKNEDGNVQAITSPDDLIGKKLGSFTICGIYSTETDRTIFERIGVSTGEEEARLPNGEYLHDSGSSIISRYFVCENYLAKIDDSTDFRIAIRLTGNLHKDKTLFEQLAGNEKGYIISLFSPYRGDLSTIRIFGEKVFIAADAGILIAFTLFSILLTANTISAGLEFRNKDIGIMRALGAKKSEITRICLAENIITAAIEFILSSIGVAVIAAVANSAFRMQVFGVNAFTLLSIFALSVAVSAIATVIPARKAAAKNPVDAINGI